MAAQPWGGNVACTLAAGSAPAGGSVEFSLAAGNAYLAPLPGAIDFSLAGSYTAPHWLVLDFTLGAEGGPPPVASVGLYLSVGVRFGRARRNDPAANLSRFGRVETVAASARLAFNRPGEVQALLRSPWSPVPSVELRREARWGVGRASDRESGDAWSAPPARDRHQGGSWNPGAARDAVPTGNDWGVVTPHDAVVVDQWRPALLPAVEYDPPPYIGGGDGDNVVPIGGRVLFSLVSPPDLGDPGLVMLSQSVIYRARVGSVAGGLPAVCHFSLGLGYAGGADFRITGRAAYLAPTPAGVSAVLSTGYAPPPASDIRSQLGASGGIVVIDPPAFVQRRSDPAPADVRWGLVPVRDADSSLPWGSGRYGGRDPFIGLPWVSDPPTPPPQPPSLKVHIVMNNVSVIRLSDGAPIEVLSVDLSANVDNWCWSVRMELADPSQLALLLPYGNGPRVVQITMNSYVWTAIIEGRDRSRGFGQTSVTVSGRSRTALLDGPYAPRRSGTEPNPRTARQLAEAELANTGFTIDWSGADWLVPGGAWYYSDLTPAAVLSDIAGAAGAVLQSHPSDAALSVTPRYPVKPWEWASATADLVLPASWVVDDSTRYASKPMYDAVMVRGEQQGVQGRITRQGSAGETFAEQVVHKLITHADVTVQRGIAAIGDRGEQELVDMQIPLFVPGAATAGATGLFLPMNLVEVQDLASNWRGLSVGLSISARRSGASNAALEVWQNVSLERHLTDAG